MIKITQSMSETHAAAWITYLSQERNRLETLANDRIFLFRLADSARLDEFDFLMSKLGILDAVKAEQQNTRKPGK